MKLRGDMLEETQREFGEGQRVRYYHVALNTNMKFWRKDFKKYDSIWGGPSHSLPPESRDQLQWESVFWFQHVIPEDLLWELFLYANRDLTEVYTAGLCPTYSSESVWACACCFFQNCRSNSRAHRCYIITLLPGSSVEPEPILKCIALYC